MQAAARERPLDVEAARVREVPRSPQGRFDREHVPAVDRCRPARSDTHLARAHDSGDRAYVELERRPAGVLSGRPHDRADDSGAQREAEVSDVVRVAGHGGRPRHEDGAAEPRGQRERPNPPARNDRGRDARERQRSRGRNDHIGPEPAAGDDELSGDQRNRGPIDDYTRPHVRISFGAG